MLINSLIKNFELKTTQGQDLNGENTTQTLSMTITQLLKYDFPTILKSESSHPL